MRRILFFFCALLMGAFLSLSTASAQCSRIGQELCQNGQVYKCEKCGSEICPIFQNRSCVVNVPSLNGTWRGTGHQTPAAASGSDYPVVMTISAGGGSIDYPSLNCGGSLTRLSGGGTSAQFRENITYGRCIDGGTISVNLVNGRLAWTWTGASQGKQYTVIAVLER